MVGQDLVVLLQASNIELLDGLGNATMDLSPTLLEQALISDLLREGVLEDVFQLWIEGLLADDLQSHQIPQVDSQFLPQFHDAPQEAESEVPANDGGHLEGAFEILAQAVYAGGQDALDSVGNLAFRQGSHAPEPVPLLHQISSIPQLPYDLLEEEWISTCLLRNLLHQFGVQF